MDQVSDKPVFQSEPAIYLAFARTSRHDESVPTTFDFRFHADRSHCVGTQYFEFVPGPYRGAHWVSGARFIDEEAFGLFEGIFEKRLPGYDHFACVNVSRPQWNPILTDMADLRARLLRADHNSVDLPFGNTLRIEDSFLQDTIANETGLAVLLSELEGWLRETLTTHDCVSVLGL